MLPVATTIRTANEIVNMATIDYDSIKDTVGEYEYTRENLVNYWIELGEDIDHWSHIVEYESTWRLDVVNPYGYYGLYQIGDTTAKYVGCPEWWRNNYKSQTDCSILVRDRQGWNAWLVNSFYNN